MVAPILQGKMKKLHSPILCTVDTTLNVLQNSIMETSCMANFNGFKFYVLPDVKSDLTQMLYILYISIFNIDDD